MGEGGRYDSDILLKGNIMANKLLFCFMCFEVREARVSMTNAKWGST